MSTFGAFVLAGLAWLGMMAAFAVKHLEKIEELLREIKDKL